MTKKSATAANEATGNPPQAGSAMPLFYTSPAPLDARKHADLALRKDFGLGFTKGVNAVPINMIEMPQVCHFYPIAFSPDEHATPVALLGLRDNENLFINERDEWYEDAYIPAYIRRYPFIFSEMPDQAQLTLCIDMNQNVIEEGGEQKFFDADGKGTTLAQNALEFCKSYHAAAQQTQEFAKFLSQSDLLVDRRAEVSVVGDRRISFSGFKIVDEQKLSQMDDKTFLEWRKRGYLPFLYAHLFSGAQWQRLTRLLNQRITKEAN